MFKSVLSVGAIRLLSIPAALFLNVFLARHLGVDDFARYTFIMSVVAVLTIPICGGLFKLISREIAVALHDKSWAYYKGIIIASFFSVIGYSLVVLCGFLITFMFLEIGIAWASIVFITPLLGLVSIVSAILRGSKEPAKAAFIETVMKPLLMVFGVVILLVIDVSGLESVLAVHVMSLCICVFVSGYFYLRSKPNLVDFSSVLYKFNSWRISIIPFTVIAFVNTFNIHVGLLILGFLGGGEQVAALRVAERGAVFVSIPLMIISSVIGPYMVNAIKNRDLTRLVSLLKKGVIFSALVALPLALLFWFNGAMFIGLTFGIEYVDIALLSLHILVIGRLFSALAGPVGVLLTASGNESQVLYSQSFAVFLNVLLCWLLIPDLGQVGAAIGGSVSLVASNIMLSLNVFRYLKSFSISK